MAGRKKNKNVLTLGILILVLIIVIGLYLILLKRNELTEEKDTTEDTSVVLADYEIEDVTEFSVKQNGTTLHLLEKDGAFLLSGEEAFPMDETQAELMIGAVAQLTAERIVDETPEDVEQYGLIEPEIIANLQLKDGTSFTLYLGDELLAGNSRYAKLEGSTTIYQVSASVRSSLQKTRLDLLHAEELPSVSGTIQTIKIESTDGRTILRYEDYNTLDRSGTNMNPWLIEKEGSSVSADSSAVTEMLSMYESFSVLDCVDYREETLKQYGLLDPSQAVRVFYLDTETETQKEITLYFGNKDEEGNFYVRAEGASYVYRMSAENAEKLLHLDIETLTDKYAVRASIDTVDKIVLTYGKVTHTAEIQRTEETQEDGTAVIKDNFILDGREFGDDSDFRSYYQSIITLKGSSLLNEAAELTEAPVLTIQLERNTEQLSVLTAEFIPYDSSYYAVVLEGTPQFLIDMRDIQQLIEETETAFAR